MHFRGVEQGEKKFQVSHSRGGLEYCSRILTCSNNVKKHEQLTRSLRKMEKTLDTVLRSIGNPGLSSIASGMVSRSQSPSNPVNKTQTLLGTPSPPPASNMHSMHQHPGSPRLHSLPDNELNPLGLLAEASLANRRAQQQAHSQLKTENTSSNTVGNVGVANEVYFKPGLLVHNCLLRSI